MKGKRTDDQVRDPAIAEAALAAWRALIDLPAINDKWHAYKLLGERLELEQALFERAQVERVN
jgi:hypothetical protein